MLLLTQANRKILPALYGQEDLAGEAIAHVKLFAPMSAWTLYVTEFDGDDTLFGWVDGVSDPELGYSSLSEIGDARYRNGMQMTERDRNWRPRKLSEIPTYIEHFQGV